MEAPPPPPPPPTIKTDPVLSTPVFGQSPSYTSLLKGYSVGPANNEPTTNADLTLVQQFWIWKATALFAEKVGLGREVHSIPKDQEETAALQKRLLATGSAGGGVRFIQLKAGTTKEARKAESMDKQRTDTKRLVDH